MSHGSISNGEGRNTEAIQRPALSSTTPPHAEPVKLGAAVRAVVIRVGEKRLHLKVLAPVSKGGVTNRDQQER